MDLEEANDLDDLEIVDDDLIPDPGFGVNSPEFREGVEAHIKRFKEQGMYQGEEYKRAFQHQFTKQFEGPNEKKYFGVPEEYKKLKAK